VDKRVVLQLPDAQQVVVTGSAGDRGVIDTIDRHGEYEPQVMSLLNRLVRPDDICIDCGANIGVLTLLLSRLCPQGRVYAFEPSERNRAYLVRNLAANGAHNVVVTPLGVYDLTGELDLHVDPRHPGGSYIASTIRTATTVDQVQVTRLDDWMSTDGVHRVDVLKLDIEGAEVRAIEGAAQLLRRWRPLCVVECNPIVLRRFHGLDARELVAVLAAIYGEVFYIEEDGVRRLDSDAHLVEVLGRCGIIDLVCGNRARPLLRVPPPPRRRNPLRRVVGTFLRASRLRSPAIRALPDIEYVYDPSYTATFDDEHLELPCGERGAVTITVHNTSRSWWSSAYAGHPVRASYRWLDAAGRTVELDGDRTVFDEPVGPGDRRIVRLQVTAPTAPGEYLLAFSPVQEDYAWFDDLRPELSVRLPVTVR
jgi:FkbM family methyltransferase